jgi:hypothetical protein
MQVPDAIELAEQIAYGDGDGISQVALNWLRAGFVRYLRGETSLEVALRLTGMARKANRNRALIQAASILDNGRNQSPWELAGNLSDAIARFDTVIRPRLNRGAEIELSPVDAAIEKAYRSGARMTRNRRHLLRLLE